MSKQIKFQNDLYRDDRIYVMNLSNGLLEIDSKKIPKFVLVTYRNNINLVATRADHFETKEEAERYIKTVEFEIPLISNNGNPLLIPANEDKWKFWTNWLKENNLNSALSRYQNMPYRYNPDGGDFEQNNYITLVVNEEGKTLIMEDMTEK
tara:strand:+ start:758 stop:1210 length:453 start_codon:yes stop_codon:yes gene_type:complete